MIAKTGLDARAIAILFGIGAVCLTLLDSIHVVTHTLVYVHPFVFGSAWWVPLLMGSAVAGGGIAYRMGWEKLGRPFPPASNAAVLRCALLFAAFYAATGLIAGHSPLKLVVITLGAVWIHRELDGTRKGLIFILIGALAGSVAEAINPGFYYVAPDYFGIPMWLPSLYACVTPVVGQLALRPLRARRKPGSDPMGVSP